MPKPTIEIDGSHFDTLNGFWEEISIRVVRKASWGRNFDAFNDILRGDFGTPQGGFKIRWNNFQRSRETLGHAETIRWLENKIEHCHPDNVEFIKRELDAARGRADCRGHHHGHHSNSWPRRSRRRRRC